MLGFYDRGAQSIPERCSAVLPIVMRTILRFLLIFTLVSLISMVAVSAFGVEYGQSRYWDSHGVGLLIGLALLPRITLLVSSVATGGLVWWLGWLFAPRILVAVLATVAYFNANPGLAAIAWLIALGGEFGEKHVWGRFKRRRPARTAEDC